MLKLSDYEPEETTLGGHTMLLWRFDYQGHDIFVTIGQTMEEFKRDPYSKQDAQAALDRYIANVSRETKQEKSMGTKNNPGSYDCYANLDPDEPYFVLRAKDPMGAALVRNWADIRRQQIEMGNKPPEDMAQVNEARQCATAMEQWRAQYLRDKIDAAERAAVPQEVPPPPPAPAQPVPLTAGAPLASETKDP